jgi:uncharacterized protein YkwD
VLVTACVLPATAAAALPAVVADGDPPVPDPATVIAAVTAGCANADVAPDELSRTAARGSLLCAVNRARSSNGLASLRGARSLRRAAGRHARDMARRGYFAHQRPGGPSLMERLHAAGWHGTAAGEAIAWGCGETATAAETVRAWLDSPSHRAILLGGYERVGVGLAGKPPAACGPGATWVLDTGSG